MKEYNGQVEKFPVEIVNKMLENQVSQGNKENVSVFERNAYADILEGGFDWINTEEGMAFWTDVIYNKNLNAFFEKYPKVNDIEVINPEIIK